MTVDEARISSATASRDQAGDPAALLIIDMINCFDFEGAETLKPRAAAAAQAIDRLRGEMTRAGLPVIYVNDNFGEWHSERSRLVDRALQKHNPVTTPLRPADEDFFIIKPQFSGFYATNLPVLLPKLGVTRLILTGITTHICVLFTAADAHMRDYRLCAGRRRGGGERGPGPLGAGDHGAQHARRDRGDHRADA